MIKCRLGSIVDVTMGQSPKSEYYNTNKEGLPFLQGNRTFGLKYPNFDTYTTCATKIAMSGDVIMSVRAPVGEINITPVKMCLGRGVCSLRMKNGNQEFLYYLIRYYAPQLINKQSGTVFGSVNRNDIEGLEVVVPENRHDQERMVRILSFIDKKIENNNAINRNLAATARLPVRATARFYDNRSRWSLCVDGKFAIQRRTDRLRNGDTFCLAC
ncbi:MAG: restriction endonuclease subunit S [Thermoguttaceae bacterium]